MTFYLGTTNLSEPDDVSVTIASGLSRSILMVISIGSGVISLFSTLNIV